MHLQNKDRAKDHVLALKNKNGSYGIVKHWMEIHPEMEEHPKFSFNQIGRHKFALERKIWGAIYIEKENPQISMNSKAEFGRNFIPKLIVDPEIEQTQARPQDTPMKGIQKFHFKSILS